MRARTRQEFFEKPSPRTSLGLLGRGRSVVADRLGFGLSQKRKLTPDLFLIQIMFFEELGPELLWRNGNIRPTLWRKVHEIPIGPHCVDMVPLQFSSPEMENPSVPLRKDMHNRQLHIIRVSL